MNTDQLTGCVLYGPEAVINRILAAPPPLDQNQFIQR